MLGNLLLTAAADCEKAKAMAWTLARVATIVVVIGSCSYSAAQQLGCVNDQKWHGIDGQVCTEFGTSSDCTLPRNAEGVRAAAACPLACGSCVSGCTDPVAASE